MKPFQEAAHVLGQLLGKFMKGFFTGAGWTCGIIYGFKIMGILP